MTARLTARLAELKQEHARGAALLRDLAAQTQQVQESLTRISGAILVLDELLSADAQETSGTGEVQECVPGACVSPGPS